MKRGYFPAANWAVIIEPSRSALAVENAGHEEVSAMRKCRGFVRIYRRKYIQIHVFCLFREAQCWLLYRIRKMKKKFIFEIAIGFFIFDAAIPEGLFQERSSIRRMAIYCFPGRLTRKLPVKVPYSCLVPSQVSITVTLIGVVSSK